MSHDLIVIGAGAAGCSAALEAARLGLDVLLVDQTRVAGAGLLATGTIPAAVLRDAARSRRDQSAGFGDLAARRDDVLRRHLTSVARQLAESGVRFEQGRAELRSAEEVQVDGCGTRRARALVIACGSRPRRPPRFPFDHRIVCDSDSALRGSRLPRSVVVIGADAVGCELSCLFAALGAHVTLVDRRRRLLRCADREILERLHEEMQRLGIVVALEEEIAALRAEGDPKEPYAVVRLGSGRTEHCERVIVLAGRESRAASLAPERAGVALDAQGFIAVDEHFETSQPGVYAVGDAVGYPMRADVGMLQGRLAVLRIAGRPLTAVGELPMAVRTLPEIASVGLIEDAARRLDLAYGVGRARFEDTLSGAIGGDARGLLKLVFSREDRRVLGVQIIGPGASELLQVGTELISSGRSIEQVANGLYLHPSFSEMYRIAALDSLRQDLVGSKPSRACLPRRLA